MTKKLDEIIAELPPERRERVNARANELATLKELRVAARKTQNQLAAEFGVGQETISRFEKRNDMLISTLRRYVESMGGQLKLIAEFPDRPPLVIKPFVKAPVLQNKKRL